MEAADATSEKESMMLGSAPTQPTRAFVISDLHLGPDTALNASIDRPALAGFARWLTAQERPPELVLAGDTFDFLQCPGYEGFDTPLAPARLRAILQAGQNRPVRCGAPRPAGSDACTRQAHGRRQHAVQDRLGQANVLQARGDLAKGRNALEAALGRYGEAEPIYRSASDRHGLSNVLAEMADAHARLGDADAAKAALTEAVSLAQQCQNRYALQLCSKVAERLGLSKEDEE